MSVVSVESVVVKAKPLQEISHIDKSCGAVLGNAVIVVLECIILLPWVKVLHSIKDTVILNALNSFYRILGF